MFDKNYTFWAFLGGQFGVFEIFIHICLLIFGHLKVIFFWSFNVLKFLLLLEKLICLDFFQGHFWVFEFLFKQKICIFVAPLKVLYSGSLRLHYLWGVSYFLALLISLFLVHFFDTTYFIRYRKVEDVPHFLCCQEQIFIQISCADWGHFLDPTRACQ